MLSRSLYTYTLAALFEQQSHQTDVSPNELQVVRKEYLTRDVARMQGITNNMKGKVSGKAEEERACSYRIVHNFVELLVAQREGRLPPKSVGLGRRR